MMKSNINLESEKEAAAEWKIGYQTISTAVELLKKVAETKKITQMEDLPNPYPQN